MTERAAIPPVAAALGYAGLLPFFAGAAALWSGPPWAGLIGSWLLAYAAIILSFMAGVRWGTSMFGGSTAHSPDAGGLALSVVPSLIGWLALTPDALIAPVTGAAVPLAFRFALCAAAFVGLWRWDLSAAKRGVAPGWYGPLRTRLTFGVCCALLVGALSPAA